MAIERDAELIKAKLFRNLMKEEKKTKIIKQDLSYPFPTSLCAVSSTLVHRLSCNQF